MTSQNANEDSCRILIYVVADFSPRNSLEKIHKKVLIAATYFMSSKSCLRYFFAFANNINLIADMNLEPRD